MYICDYNAIVDTFVTELTTANSVTAPYDLSDGMGKRVQHVRRVDLDIHPEMLPDYPIVNVRLIDRREYPGANTGTNYNRTVFLDMKIEALYHSLSDAEVNLWKLVSNIEAILRYNRVLWKYRSGGFKVEHILPKSTNFVAKFKGESSVFQMAANINLEVKGLLKSI